MGAIGVVFGDIGTSPLYSLQTVFSIEHNAVAPTREDVFGVISMVFWSITLIVSVKYVSLVMRADNDGEGGILSLVALLRRTLAGKAKFTAIAMLLGIMGASLFYGDSVITPAISVMSAIEGLHVVNPSFESLVLPLSIIILSALFAVQRFGTSMVGRFFGPVMAIWFLSLAALGLPWALRDPEILAAISPHYALAFFIKAPWVAFIALGAVVLTITGTEALYADMGHFGRRPIRFAWFALVFPCLTIVYMGMGGMILEHPDYVDNPLFRMAPGWAQLPLVILATLATVIASQAVISGAFSVSRQATRIGILPRLNVKHTSKDEGGQVYIGSINWILFVGHRRRHRARDVPGGLQRQPGRTQGARLGQGQVPRDGDRPRRGPLLPVIVAAGQGRCRLAAALAPGDLHVALAERRQPHRGLPPAARADHRHGWPAARVGPRDRRPATRCDAAAGHRPRRR